MTHNIDEWRKHTYYTDPLVSGEKVGKRKKKINSSSSTETGAFNHKFSIQVLSHAVSDVITY